MLWSTLLNRLKTKPGKNLKHGHVHAVLMNQKTGKYEIVFLELKSDASGNPYLIKEEKPHQK